MLNFFIFFVRRAYIKLRTFDDRNIGCQKLSCCPAALRLFFIYVLFRWWKDSKRRPKTTQSLDIYEKKKNLDKLSLNAATSQSSKSLYYSNCK